MSGRGASDFGPLHIPFKKWGAAANLPHAHQFDQNMQRIEDWAERLRSGGIGGGVTPMMDGRRFRFDASADGAVLDATAIGIPLDSPPLIGVPGKRNYSTHLTGTFDLVITAISDGQPAPAQYLIECWVQPTDWPELISPISRQNFTWVGEGHVSISYEWMINWFWDRMPEYAEEFYGFEPPMNIDPVKLVPQIRVTWVDAPTGGENQISVGGEAVLHALTMGNTEGADSSRGRVDLELLDVEYTTPVRVPASTVAFSNAPPAVKGWVFEGSWSDDIVSQPGWSPNWSTDPTGLIGSTSFNITSRTLSLQDEVSSDGPEVVLDDGKLMFNAGGEYRFTVTMHIRLRLSGTALDTVVFSVQGTGLGVLGFSPEYVGSQDDTYQATDTSTAVVSPGHISTIDWRSNFTKVFEEALMRAALPHLRLQIEKVS